MGAHTLSHVFESIKLTVILDKKIDDPSRGDLVHMGTSAPFTFKVLKISKSHTSMSLKFMILNI
jgi:hypothetical protein